MIIAGYNNADAASAPTGCAAALIDGSTHARLMAIPVGKSATKAPTNLISTNSSYLQYMKKSFSEIVARFMDEHSMMGLQDWAWAKYRNEELRRHNPPVMDEESNELPVGDRANDNEPQDTAASAFILNTDTSLRPWGGIPFVYSYGDTNQIPPVCKKSTYDTRAPKTAADRAGIVAFREIITTTNPSKSMATVVVMEEVVRQTDEVFKTILQHMRDGTLNNVDIDILLYIMLENLPIEDKQRFLSEGLILVPTWIEANTINIEYIQNNLTTHIAR
jgi:hypothetical protein